MLRRVTEAWRVCDGGVSFRIASSDRIESRSLLINCLIPLVTHVDVLGQEVVGRLVLLEEVAIGGAAGEEAAEKEAKEAGRQSG